MASFKESSGQLRNRMLPSAASASWRSIDNRHDHFTLSTTQDNYNPFRFSQDKPKLESRNFIFDFLLQIVPFSILRRQLTRPNNHFISMQYEKHDHKSPLRGPQFNKTRRKTAAWKVTNIAANEATEGYESIDVHPSGVVQDGSQPSQNSDANYFQTSTSQFENQIDTSAQTGFPESASPNTSTTDSSTSNTSNSINQATEQENRPNAEWLQVEQQETLQRIDSPHPFGLKDRQRQKTQDATHSETDQHVVNNKSESIDAATHHPYAYQPLNSFLVPLMDLAMMPTNQIVPSADSFASTFAADDVQSSLEFEPNWEVDNFQNPIVVSALLSQCRAFFDEFTDTVCENVLGDEKRLVVTGVKCGEGRTTVAISLARKLAARGQRICLVDADLVNPDMADRLGLDNEISWLTDQAEFESAAEFLIRNSEDNLCLMPLTPSSRVSFAKHAYEILDNVICRIEPFFDRIIFDFGPVSHIDASTFRMREFAKSALLVHDPVVSDVFEYSRAFDKFQSFGLDRFALLKNTTRRPVISEAG